MPAQMSGKGRGRRLERAGERRLWHLCDACSAPDLSWLGRDHGHPAGAVLFRVFASLGSNWFDQARVIILDVPDTRAHRPAGHLFGGKRR